MAKLYFRYGAMNSGKTTLLMAVAHNYEDFLKEKAELFRGIIISKSKQTKIPITQSEFQHLIHNAENIHYYSPDKKRIERKDEAEIFENYLASKGNLSLEEKKYNYK